MIVTYYTTDHPEANGRQPKKGEQAWTLTFPLANGDDYLELHIGPKGRDALKRMLEQEEFDNTKESTNV